MGLPACRSLLPDVLCQNSEMAVYLLPSVLLALLIRVLAGRHPVFFIFTLAGTLCHELAHALAGALSGAAPSSLTIIPRRKGRHWELGSVTLNRVRWYNAAPAALAPLLILAIPLIVAWWRTRGAWTFHVGDVLIAFLLAPQLLSFWPSAVDWRIAARSWPYLFIIVPLAWLFARYCGNCFNL